MKISKLIFITISLMMLLFMVSCQKESDVTEKYVKINITNKTTSNLKSDNCSDLIPNYVLYQIDGGDEFKTIQIVQAGGLYWTKNIKLVPGSHILNEFLVMNNNDTPYDTNDDIVISATPHEGSEFARFVNFPLDKSFETYENQVTEIGMEVICYDSTNAASFGFNNFFLDQIQMKKLKFFGLFDITNKELYEGANSLYSTQSNWNHVTIPTENIITVPAIFKLDVYKNNVLDSTYLNSVEGEPISFKYSNNLNGVNDYRIELFVWVCTGFEEFGYVHFKTWQFSNQSNITEGGDGVVNFYLGENYDPTTLPDYIFPTWNVK